MTETEASPTGMSVGDRLAYERTNLAHERTLMAWTRTATSLITFGFAIYKFFQLEGVSGLRPRTHAIIGPRHFAMFMIIIGLFALAVATIQHWQHRDSLRKQGIEISRSLAAVVAGLISLLGILAIVAVILRM
jgi:putative membrane protein